MMFTSYETEKVMDSYGNIYLLQYGSYTEKKVMEENTQKLNDYIIVEHDNKYYVYLGVFTNIETTKKMQELFKNNNIYTYIKTGFNKSALSNYIEMLNNEYYDKVKVLDEKEIELSNIKKRILTPKKES